MPELERRKSNCTSFTYYPIWTSDLRFPLEPFFSGAGPVLTAPPALFFSLFACLGFWDLWDAHFVSPRLVAVHALRLGTEHPINQEGVKVKMGIDRGPRTLHERDSAEAGVGGRVGAGLAQRSLDLMQEHSQHAPGQIGVAMHEVARR